ncbi:hypothetical protein BJ508DRAFT_349846 [Ascobolus immersus RN42]|uniref:Exonuclease domain-containing protein n=1 Tax=Ascobolus immersus RN42 TaxID=1160509 RepID=A0A3N4I051_ASCIM|nr:hypothetical protein BJ508DRAFT_349846 [Ascobolus immersus RN42]
MAIPTTSISTSISATSAEDQHQQKLQKTSSSSSTPTLLKSLSSVSSTQSSISSSTTSPASQASQATHASSPSSLSASGNDLTMSTNHPQHQNQNHHGFGQNHTRNGGPRSGPLYQNNNFNPRGYDRSAPNGRGQGYNNNNHKYNHNNGRREFFVHHNQHYNRNQHQGYHLQNGRQRQQGQLGQQGQQGVGFVDRGVRHNGQNGGNGGNGVRQLGNGTNGIAAPVPNRGVSCNTNGSHNGPGALPTPNPSPGPDSERGKGCPPSPIQREAALSAGSSGHPHGHPSPPTPGPQRQGSRQQYSGNRVSTYASGAPRSVSVSMPQQQNPSPLKDCQTMAQTPTEASTSPVSTASRQTGQGSGTIETGSTTHVSTSRTSGLPAPSAPPGIPHQARQNSDLPPSRTQDHIYQGQIRYQQQQQMLSTCHEDQSKMQAQGQGHNWQQDPHQHQTMLPQKMTLMGGGLYRGQIARLPPGLSQSPMGLAMAGTMTPSVAPPPGFGPSHASSNGYFPSGQNYYPYTPEYPSTSECPTPVQTEHVKEQLKSEPKEGPPKKKVSLSLKSNLPKPPRHPSTLTFDKKRLWWANIKRSPAYMSTLRHLIAPVHELASVGYVTTKSSLHPDFLSTPTDAERKASQDPRVALLAAHRVIAIDCEMAESETGEDELIRLTAVDYFAGVPIIDKLVDPSPVAIVDWRTGYSGVTKEMMDEAVKAGTAIVGGWKAAREMLWKFMTPDTVLVMHGGKGDLNALKMIHLNVVDSYVTEFKLRRAMLEDLQDKIEADSSDTLTPPPPPPTPRARDYPTTGGYSGLGFDGCDNSHLPIIHQRDDWGLSLKKLVYMRFLKREIQRGEGGKRGHDSFEDAMAARELVHLHVAWVMWALGQDGKPSGTGESAKPFEHLEWPDRGDPKWRDDEREWHMDERGSWPEKWRSMKGYSEDET